MGFVAALRNCKSDAEMGQDVPKNRSADCGRVKAVVTVGRDQNRGVEQVRIEFVGVLAVTFEHSIVKFEAVIPGDGGIAQIEHGHPGVSGGVENGGQVMADSVHEDIAQVQVAVNERAIAKGEVIRLIDDAAENGEKFGVEKRIRRNVIPIRAKTIGQDLLPRVHFRAKTGDITQMNGVQLRQRRAEIAT